MWGLNYVTKTDIDEIVLTLRRFATEHGTPLQIPFAGPKAERATTPRSALDNDSRKQLADKLQRDAQALSEQASEYGREGRIVVVGLLGFAVLIYVSLLSFLVFLPSGNQLMAAFVGTIAEGGVVYFIVRQMGKERERQANLIKDLAIAKVLNTLQDLVLGLKASDAIVDVVIAAADLVKSLKDTSVPKSQPQLAHTPRAKRHSSQASR